MKRLWWKIVGGIVAVGVLVIVGLLLAPKSPVLPEIKRQLTSTLLLPKGGGAVVDQPSVKYDKSNKLLSFNVAYVGTTLVVSEQPTPDSFIDIPEVYNKLVDGMGNYQSFDVNVGTVHLTKPKNQGDKQVGVLNTKGTLLFAKADANLSDDQWRVLFNNFQVQN